MKDKRILFGICGSFCNHAKVLKQLEILCVSNDVQIIVSENVYTCDTRFYKAMDFLIRLKELSGHSIIHTIVEAEKVGPMNTFDLMVIAPMTATVASKLVHGSYDHPVTLGAKAMLRNKKNVVFGIATNDGLSISGANIFTLINFKNIYVIPFRQDAPFEKERSIVSDWDLLIETCEHALDNHQLEPILLGGK